MKAHNATTAVTTVVAPGNYDFLHIKNVSDTDVFLKYDGSQTTLTAANGMQLSPGETLALHSDGTRNPFRHGVQCIHNSTGSKELRVQGAD